MSRFNSFLERPYAALILDDLEEYHELIAELTSAINDKVSLGIAYHNRALAYWEIGEDEKALDGFGLAENLLTENHMPSFVKGMLFKNLGRLDEAIESLGNAVLISPNESRIWLSRATILVSTGNLKESILDYNRAIKLEPTFEYAWKERNKILEKLGEPKIEYSAKVWWQFWRK